jgi:hypothetical protein
MKIILTNPAAQNIDATAVQHIGTIYILWLPMKMDVSTAFLGKMVNPCLTKSPQIQGNNLLLL